MFKLLNRDTANYTIEKIAEQAGIPLTKIRELPHKVIDLISESLQTIQQHQECLVDSDLNAKDVLDDLIRVSLQNYLFIDRVQRLARYAKSVKREQIWSRPCDRESTRPQLKQFIDTVNKDIKTAFKELPQIEEDCRQLKISIATLTKKCTIDAEKASDNKFKGWLKAVMLLSSVSFAGIVIIATCMMPTAAPLIPAISETIASAATALETVGDVTTALATTNDHEAIYIPGVTTLTAGAKLGAVASGAGTILADLLTATHYWRCIGKYTKMIESFAVIRQQLDEMERYRFQMNTDNTKIKRQLEAIQAAVKDIDFHKKKCHSSKAVNGSIDTLIDKLYDLHDQVQPATGKSRSDPVVID